MVGTLKEGRKLGWLPAAMLALFMLSSSAWALDIDEELERQNAESSQILNTLGRDRGQSPTGEGINARSKRQADEVKVELIPARKISKKSS